MYHPNQTGPAGPAAMGAPDELALKRRRYEQAMGLANDGFQPGGQGFMPGQHQAPGAPPGPVPGSGGAPLPFQAVVAQLRARPGMMEHLEGIDLDGDGIPDIPPGPGPRDPMAAAHWEAMLRDRQRLIQAARLRGARRKEANNQVLLATLEVGDPMFAMVADRLAQYINSLPPKIRQAYAQAVERTPGAFLELYTYLREGLSALMRAQGAAASGPEAEGGGEDPRQRIRRAVSGRMSAPVLESAGVMDDLPAGGGRAAERAALVKRVRSGGAREGDLLRYLELCGV